MGAHVFVVHGDLTQIQADHLLVPCDAALNVTTAWASLLGPTRPGAGHWIKPLDKQPPDGFTAAVRPPVSLDPLADERTPWLVNSAHGEANLDWLLSGITSAIRHIATYGDRPPRNQRERQLIALPLFGVGEGGYGMHRGAVIRRLLDELSAAIRGDHAPDVVLVLSKRADYAAVQSQRQGIVTKDKVRDLAERVRRGGLVLFIGAGASAGAGFPTWKDLLKDLAQQAKLADIQEAVLKLPAPDAADVIGASLPGRQLQNVIADRFRQTGFSLTHGLLASLRVNEAVTTNYDTLYENAARLPLEGKLRVLPRERRESDEPWLLKLHGDIELENSIVLTRDQYVRFDADSAPLASVVQSLMVTKHMLFVGYSLSDENFIRLARQVRQLFVRMGSAGRLEVGTVLSLFDDPARERLWRADLDFVPMTHTAGSEEGIPPAARELEIFLDQLAAASCDEASYVLDDRYADLLSEQDKSLAALARPLLDEAAGDPDTAAWRKATALLRDLGWSGNGSGRPARGGVGHHDRTAGR